ncbi:MAG: CopG family transcriptional regulator [Actinomycetota bacterium]|nr:CopG family transcriptional regulator [Actinomycetota bacterium]
MFNMSKKVIQVPVDDNLLEAPNIASKKEGLNRSELIRQACHQYLRGLMAAELDSVYEKGYEQVPEEPVMGEVQVDLSSKALPEESW